MTIRRIRQIKPGMIINTDVHDKSGRLLLGKGASITDRHMVVFMTWGVSEVDADPPKKVEEVAETEVVEKTEETEVPPEVEKLFSHVDRDHVLMRELFQYCCSNPPETRCDHGS
jgi:hypothetical protein